MPDLVSTTLYTEFYNMPWQRHKDGRGDYEVNWTGVETIVRSYSRSESMLYRSKPHIESQGGFLPDLHTVEVDWGGFASDTDAITRGYMQQIRATAARNMTENEDLLKVLTGKTERNRAAFISKQKSAQAWTMANIETSVSVLGESLDKLRTIRDLSATAVLAGATYLSGGAVLAGVPISGTVASGGAIGIGAGLKGVARFEDTGDVMGSVITFGANLVLGALDLKVTKGIGSVAEKGMRQGLTYLWTMGKGMLSAPQGMAEGNCAKEAMTGGAIKTVTGVHIELAKSMFHALEWKPLAIFLDTVADRYADKAAEHFACGSEGEKEKPGKKQTAETSKEQLAKAIGNWFMFHESMVPKVAVRRPANHHHSAPHHKVAAAAGGSHHSIPNKPTKLL